MNKDSLITSSKSGRFQLMVPLVKTSGAYIIEKNDPAGKPGYFLLGEASNTKVDKTLERVRPEFLQTMKQQAVGMTVFAEHKRVITKTLGYVAEVSGDENSFQALTHLEHPSENKLTKRILAKLNHGTRLGYSFGGIVSKLEKSTVNGKPVLDLVEGELVELTVTAMPAGNVDWISAIQKSLSQYRFPNEDLTPMNSEKLELSAPMLKNLTDEVTLLVFKKTLTQMVQSQGLQRQLGDYYSAYREAIWQIVYNNSDTFTPEQRKAAILKVSQEFADKVEVITTGILNLAEQIQSVLSGTV